MPATLWNNRNGYRSVWKVGYFLSVSSAVDKVRDMIEICGAWNGNSKAFNFGKLGNRVKLFPIHSQNARFRNYREQKVSASVPHLPSPGNSPIFQFRSAMIPVWFRFEFREVWIKEEFFEWFSSLSLKFCEVQITFKSALRWPS